MTYAPKKRFVSLGSAEWRQIRAQVLAEEPLCRMCKARGLVVAATDVDHILDSREDFSDDNRRENLQSLCHECHSLKTARDMGKNVTLGCDASGLPVDPDHHWNRETKENFPELLEKSPATDGENTAPPKSFYC